MEIMYNFVFIYPLFMAFVWIFGTIIFERSRMDKEEDEEDLPQTPKVSVVIPCHNEQYCIKETVEFLMKQDYPDFEIVVVDDGSTDNTPAILKELQQRYDCLKIVSLKSNRGKGTALTMGALASCSEYLVCTDADALLDPMALRRFVYHFIKFPRVGAITGNPRIRNRTSILGKIQVGEFSSIVGMIKRTQRILGKIYTVSGVVAAFRKSALLSVGFWSHNMHTEDVDISWKLQLKFWDIRYEPRALCWILMPETISGLLSQRLRWAQGGSEVLLKYFRTLMSWKQRRMWPLYIEYIISVLWSYSLALTVIIWIINVFFKLPKPFAVNFLPGWAGATLSMTCLLQCSVGFMADSKYEKNLFRLFIWLIWYPYLYWIINAVVAIIGFPMAVFKNRRSLAVWESPDRGLR